MRKEAVERVVGNIKATNNLDLDLLKPIVSEIKSMQERYSGEITRPIDEALMNALQREIEAAEAVWVSAAGRNDYNAAKQAMEESFENLLSSAKSAFADLPNASAMWPFIEGRNKEKIEQLRALEFAYCKSEFNRIRNTTSVSNIEPVLNILTRFRSRWASPGKELQEVSDVIKFLESIKGGIRCELGIVSGNFKDYEGWLTTPNTFIELYSGAYVSESTSLGSTNHINSAQPQFNAGYTFAWNVGTQFTFVGKKEGKLYGADEIFRRTVSATGLFGYKELSGSLYDSQHRTSVYIKLDLINNIPKCPWE
ncbi:hypothetical protein AGMMS50276_32170 [Synergistales bacterium]|nr:hypothetical protein AGMMS50276_32170 [Synergistales bacterium]